jgi:hypothetical protein
MMSILVNLSPKSFEIKREKDGCSGFYSNAPAYPEKRLVYGLAGMVFERIPVESKFG